MRDTSHPLSDALPLAPAGAGSAAAKKELGAYYTREAVVRFLLDWGLRKPRRAVLDPSCGDGRFLHEALGRGVPRVLGCDVDRDALEHVRQVVAPSASDRLSLHHADFFTLESADLGGVDLIVGNPPFIRYQRFVGDARRRGLAAALRAGVKLTGLTSSWAPFLLHAMQCLDQGGDLAMVVPAEIVQTQYGLPTLRALAGGFGAVTLLSFERNLFPDAQEETFLLLAENRASGPGTVRLVPLRGAGDLGLPPIAPAGAFEVDLAPRTEVRFAEAFLTPDERAAWAVCRAAAEVRELGTLGTVTNGYVTGDNEFFHCRREDALARGIPAPWLLPTARNSRSLRGLAYLPGDVDHHEAARSAHHLVRPVGVRPADQAVLAGWVGEGERRGVPERFKCRTRTPWWLVPGLQDADLLLTYMAGARPRAAVNRAGAVYTNSLHGIRLAAPAHALLVALSFHSSLTLLSLELQGRSYGGGILKLEPREMAKVVVAWPGALPEGEVSRVAAEVDQALRRGEYEGAVAVVDQWLLVQRLGLRPEGVARLRSARARLGQRRSGRAKGRGHGPDG